MEGNWINNTVEKTDDKIEKTDGKIEKADDKVEKTDDKVEKTDDKVENNRWQQTRGQQNWTDISHYNIDLITKVIGRQWEKILFILHKNNKKVFYFSFYFCLVN